MMDYEGIVRASARTHAPKSGAPGAMGVVAVGRPDAPALKRQQQQGQSAPAQQRQQFGGASSYPTPMAMR